MTNLGSIVGGLIWGTIACLLMIITLTPAPADANAFTMDCVKAESAPMCLDMAAGGGARSCPVFLA